MHLRICATINKNDCLIVLWQRQSRQFVLVKPVINLILSGHTIGYSSNHPCIGNLVSRAISTRVDAVTELYTRSLKLDRYQLSQRKQAINVGGNSVDVGLILRWDYIDITMKSRVIALKSCTLFRSVLYTQIYPKYDIVCTFHPEYAKFSR